MGYAVCDQTFWLLWELLIVIYNIAIIVCIFWQAGHVSQMKIKNLAVEGDTSVRSLLMVVVAAVCLTFVTIIFAFSGNYYVLLIVAILGSMTFPVMTITMIFLPKVI